MPKALTGDAADDRAVLALHRVDFLFTLAACRRRVDRSPVRALGGLKRTGRCPLWLDGHLGPNAQERAAVEPNVDDQVGGDGDEEGVVVVVAEQHAGPAIAVASQCLGLGVADEVAVGWELDARLFEGVEEFDNRADSLGAQRLLLIRIAAV
eukprot:7385998-Prymnesium_polylepis.1